MISNNNSESTSKKRQRDSTEKEPEFIESKKILKLEANEAVPMNDNNFKEPISITPNHNRKEIGSNLYKSQSRINYLDFIWKLEIPKSQFEDKFIVKKKLIGREDNEYCMGILNIFYPGTMSSSLLFVFQNGKGLTEEEFSDELSQLEKDIQVEDVKVEEGNGEMKYPSESITISEETNMQNAINDEQTQSQHQESTNCNNSSNASQATVNSEDSILQKLTALKGRYYKKPKEEDEDCPEDGRTATFDITLAMTAVNYKVMQIQLKNVKHGEIIIREFQLSTAFFSRIQEDEVLVIELLIKKNYNREVGFTGIINEAMTCYMNSMIQSLSILGYFKRAVFNIPFEHQSSVAYSLQRLFYDLTFERDPVSTNRLIQSFGWSHDDIFIQHDVQEFNILLSDLMEKKMVGTKSEGAFKYLFEGKVINYIECIDFDYKSSKEESFCDIQLTVKSCKNIYESLSQFTEEEILDNDDMYLVEGHGKKKAKKGISFIKIPPVLICQLKRFEYNPKKGQMDKINDYFEFYDEINLAPYLQKKNKSPGGDDDADQIYSLHSIVVHKGNANTGHYFAFIKPNTNPEWYMFNDDIVREADLHEVFENNYGGSVKFFKHKDRGIIAEINSKSDASAYILIYIKKSLRDVILKKFCKEDIPHEIISIIEKEKYEERRLEIMRERKEKNMDVYLLSKEILQSYHGLGLSPPFLDISEDKPIYENPDYNVVINLPKNLLVEHLYRFISQEMRIPVRNIALFTYSFNCPNKILYRNNFRMHHLDDSMYDKEISDVYGYFNENYKIQKRMYIYIHISGEEYSEFCVLQVNNGVNSESEDEIEIEIDNMNKERVYIPCSNKYKLGKFEYFDNAMEIEEQDSSNNSNISNGTPSARHNLLIFKFLDFRKGISALTLSIEQINLYFSVNTIHASHLISQCRDVYRTLLGDQILANIQNYEESSVSFYLEKTSGEYFSRPLSNDNTCSPSQNGNEELLQSDDKLTFETEQIILIDDINKMINNTKNTDSLVLIVNLSFQNKIFLYDSQPEPVDSIFEEMSRICQEYAYKVFLPVIYRNEYQHYTLLEKEIFYLNEDDLMIKKRLFSYYPPSKLKSLITENKEETYVYDNKKVLIHINEFVGRLCPENFHLSLQKYHNMGEEYSIAPLLKYMASKSNNHKIEFTICTLSNESMKDFFPFEIVLFDLYNNPMATLILHVPIEIFTFQEIIDYIFDKVLSKFFIEYEYPKEKFYFIIQHPEQSHGYDIILDKYKKLAELRQYTGPFLYRLQPFPEIIKCDETIVKVYFAFQTTNGEPVCDPLILVLNRDITVINVKKIIFEKLEKMKKVRNNPYIELYPKKVKFYTYSVFQFKPMKEVLLLNTKDEEQLLSFFSRDCVITILVEFIPSENEALRRNPSKGELSMNI